MLNIIRKIFFKKPAPADSIRKRIALLTKIEEERGIILPPIYEEFYRSCLEKIPDSLIGTDVISKTSGFNNWALELLEEDKCENFLSNDDFVFMMHQGYMFWYFKADGQKDPIVFYYHEGRHQPEQIGIFSDFIKKIHS